MHQSNLIELLNIQESNIVFLFDNENIINSAINHNFDKFCMEFFNFLQKVKKMERINDIILIFICKKIANGCNMTKIIQMKQTFELLLKIPNLNFKIIQSTLPEDIETKINKPSKKAQITLNDKLLYNFLDIKYGNYLVVQRQKGKPLTKLEKTYKDIIITNEKIKHNVKQHDDYILLLLAKQLRKKNIFCVIFSDDNFRKTEILSIYFKLPIIYNDNNLRKQTLDINFDYNSFNFWFHRQNGYEIVSKMKYNKKNYLQFKKLLSLEELKTMEPLIDQLIKTDLPLLIEPERRVQIQEMKVQKLNDTDIQILKHRLQKINNRLKRFPSNSFESKYLKYKFKYLSLKLFKTK